MARERLYGRLASVGSADLGNDLSAISRQRGCGSIAICLSCQPGRRGVAVASLDRIRTDGFRRWYEMQLIECHAWLVSWFLGLILLVSGAEIAGVNNGSRLGGILLLLGGLAVTLFSWARYRLLLEIAERLGEQAVCPGCETYARFSTMASGPSPLPDGGDPLLENHGGGIWLRVKCKKCGDEWMLR